MGLKDSVLDPKNRGGKILALLIVFILPIAFIFGVFFLHHEHRQVEHPPPSIFYSYYVDLEIDENVTYTLYLPTWISSDGMPISDILDIEFREEGEGNVSIVETENGPALAIESQGSIKLPFSRRGGQFDVSPVQP